MANFDEAFEITIKNETGGDPDGGYTNDSSDRGLATKWGISEKSHPSLDIKNLTKDEAKEIYRKEYWNKIKGDKIHNQAIANKFFDIVVNMGFAAIKIMQTAVNMLRKKMNMSLIGVDGIVGDETIIAINMCNPAMLLDEFKELVIRKYRQINNPKYEKGWIKRAEQ